MSKILKNDYVFSLFNKFLTVLFGVFSSAFINRYLGPSLKGEYAYIINLINIIVIIANLGFYQSYPNQKRKHMENQLHTYLDVFSLQFIIYLAIIVVVVKWGIFPSYGIALFLIPIQVLTNQLAMIALIEFIRFKQKAQIGMLFVNFFMCLCLFLFFKSNLYYAIIVLMLKDLGFIILYLVKTKYLPNPLNVQLNFVKCLVSYGVYAMVSALLLQLNYKVDILFLGNMTNSTEVGLYSVGVALAEYVWLIPDAFKEVLFARTAKSDSTNEIVISIKLNIAIVVSIIVAMFIVGKYIIWMLYGTDFVPSFGVTCIVFLGIPAMTIFKVTNPLYLANGHQKFFCFTLLISAVINCVLNFALIPTLGKNGAAIASAVSYTVCGLIFYFRFITDYKINWKEPLILRKSDINKVLRGIKK